MGPGSKTGSDIILRPLPHGQTNMSKNITFPKTSFTGGNENIIHFRVRNAKLSYFLPQNGIKRQTLNESFRLCNITHKKGMILISFPCYNMFAKTDTEKNPSAWFLENWIESISYGVGVPGSVSCRY